MQVGQQRTVRGRAVASAFGKSKKGSDQIALAFETADGAKLTYLGSFASEKSVDFTVQALRNCGWRGTRLVELHEPQNIGTLLPTEVDLVLEVEEWEGRFRERIKWVNRVGGGEFKFSDGLSGNDVAALSARLESIVARTAPRGAPAAPAAVSAVSAVSDDQIPF